MDSEATLPHATVKQIIQRSINPTYKFCSESLTNTVSELAQDFILHLSELAYTECIDSGKKTITPEHVISVMKRFNLSITEAEISQFIEDLDKLRASKPKEQLKLKMHGLSNEQLLEEQGKLFESAEKQAAVVPEEKELEEDLENYD